MITELEELNPTSNNLSPNSSMSSNSSERFTNFMFLILLVSFHHTFPTNPIHSDYRRTFRANIILLHTIKNFWVYDLVSPAPLRLMFMCNFVLFPTFGWFTIRKTETSPFIGFVKMNMFYHRSWYSCSRW